MAGVLLTLVAVASLSQASSAAKPASKKAAIAPDAEIEALIRKKFAGSKIAVNGFTVTVRGGTATIDGKTNVLQHKGTATRLAKNAGARRVVNRVAVSREAKDKAAAHLRAARKRAQVKRAPPGGEPRSGR